MMLDRIPRVLPLISRAGPKILAANWLSRRITGTAPPVCLVVGCERRCRGCVTLWRLVVDGIRVGVIGCGYWGSKHVRVLHGLDGVANVALIDERRERLD